jgi:hypothetical protein
LAANGRVNKRDNTTESCGGGKSRVGADRWNADNEGVEVLLCGDEATSGGDGSITCSELGDDLVGLSELAARVGSSKKKLDGASGKSSCLAGLSQVGQRGDGGNSPVSLFLTETANGVSLCVWLSKLLEQHIPSLSNGYEKGDESGLSIHLDDFLRRLAQS